MKHYIQTKAPPKLEWGPRPTDKAVFNHSPVIDQEALRNATIQALDRACLMGIKRPLTK